MAGVKRILLSILAIGILPLSACGTPATTPEDEELSASQEQPRVISHWIGAGTKTTENFTVDSAPWAIEWINVPTVIRDRSLGSLQIMVYDTEKPGIPVAIAADSRLKESGTYYMHETGTFFIMINAANTRWMVKVIEVSTLLSPPN